MAVRAVAVMLAVVHYKETVVANNFVHPLPFNNFFVGGPNGTAGNRANMLGRFFNMVYLGVNGFQA
jgi:hypothetical protein